MTDEPGYTTEELERGEDNAWHIPAWRCLVVLLILALIAGYIWYGLATSTDL